MGWGMVDTPKFIVDCNVGKLARWLRLMGYEPASSTGTTIPSWWLWLKPRGGLS